MDTETIELVRQMIEKVDVLGSNLLEVAMKQQAVRIIQTIPWLFLGILLLYASYKCFIYVKNTDSLRDYEKNLPYIIIAVVAIGTIISTLSLVGDIIQWVLNPEYAAINEIISLLKVTV